MQDTQRAENDPLPPASQGAAPEDAKPAAAGELPPLFRVGVILIAGKAILWLGLLCLGWVALAIGISIGLTEARGDEEVGLVIGGVVGTAVLAALALFQVIVLALSLKAWRAGRPWVYALMVLAVLNLASGNPIGIAVGVVALIGCVQVLDRNGARPLG